MRKRKPIVIEARLGGESSAYVKKTAHLDPHGRRLQDPGGRPSVLTDVAEQRLRERVRDWAVSWKKRTGAWPKVSSKTTEVVVRKFAAEENAPAEMSWSVLRDRVVYPVLRDLESH
jgi:hypothetical protein